jgi:hypothetical protein
MNIAEGAKRIQYVGRLIAFYPLSVGVVAAGLLAVTFALAVCFPAAAGLEQAAAPLFFLLTLVCGMIAATGGILWLAGWIIEGFGKDAE